MHNPPPEQGDLPRGDPIRYRGYFYDTETGYYYLNSRYYDPVTHRFLNGDVYASTGQGTLGSNMFAYCQNNPISYYDPVGTLIQTAIYNDGARGHCEDIRELEEKYILSEHHKRGTTNPANRKKHEGGLARKNRDAGKEKGDKRRPIDRSNKRRAKRFELDFAPEPIYNPTPVVAERTPWEMIMGGAVIVVGGATIVYIVANDATGVGIIDDVAIPAIIALIANGWQTISV